MQGEQVLHFKIISTLTSVVPSPSPWHTLLLSLSPVAHEVLPFAEYNAVLRARPTWNKNNQVLKEFNADTDIGNSCLSRQFLLNKRACKAFRNLPSPTPMQLR